MLSWVRRSRLAWNWVDEIEAPTDGGFNGFRVRLSGAAGSFERDVTENACALDAAEWSVVGSGPLTIEVRQIGPTSLSRPAITTINA